MEADITSSNRDARGRREAEDPPSEHCDTNLHLQCELEAVRPVNAAPAFEGRYFKAS